MPTKALLAPGSAPTDVASTTLNVTSPPKQLLRLRTVIERTGLSKTAIYTTPSFPKPVKLTAMASAWVASEIDAWIDGRMAARDVQQR